MRAVNVQLEGILQGVGFRPFVYNLAQRHGVRGWVRNNGSGAEIEAEAEELSLDRFLEEIRNLSLPSARVQHVRSREIVPPRFNGFEIRVSDEGSLPDVSTAVSLGADTTICSECLKELLNPGDRRYLFPFISCTNCGPRYSIARRPPFDRERTSMSRFQMCDACISEYRTPPDRRFHSQTNSCWDCGPSLRIWDGSGRVTAQDRDAVRACVALLRGGAIVAIKSVGGFQLLADACNEEVITKLRQRKNRGEKPFALLLGSIAAAKNYCELSSMEEQVLESPAAPILLASRKSDAPMLAPSVAPGLDSLGIMLPCSPLHSLIAHFCAGPLVATSGNLDEEPLCTNENQAGRKLSSIADAFLIHDRVIENPVDDSIVRVIAQRPVVLRRARGYAPFAVRLPSPAQSTLGLGAHLKNTVGIGRGDWLYLSPHVGSLSTVEAVERWHREADTLASLYGSGEDLTPTCDLHPEYASFKPSAVKIQHHYAHVLSCLADNGAKPPVLGVAWDGGGYGTDHSIWGGEFIEISSSGEFERSAHLKPFRLVGGEQAIREPRRAALGLFHALYGDDCLSKLPMQLSSSFSPMELRLFCKMLHQGVNSPICTSMGRLFDAVSALIGLRSRCSYEGQAAVELELLASRYASQVSSAYLIPMLKTTTGAVLDWAPLIENILADLIANTPTSQIAWRFHAACATSIVTVARHIGIKRIALTGGVFQNKLLIELTTQALRDADFDVLLHQAIPPGDGGIAAGQVYAMTLPYNQTSITKAGHSPCV